MTNMSSQMNEVRHRASGWVQRAPPKVVSMIDEPGHPTGHSRDPLQRGDHHVEDHFRSAACRFRSRRARACRSRQGTAPVTKTTTAPVQDHPGAGHQGRAVEAERAERQCQDGPPSSQASTAIIAPTSRWVRSRRTQSSKVTIKHVTPPPSAAETDPRARLIHIAPPRPADIRPGPRPLLPQWRAGRCCRLRVE